MTPATSKLPKLHSFEEIAAEYSGVSVRTMKDRARAKKFAYIRIGNAWLMNDAQLEAFLAANTRDPEAAADPLAADRERVARSRQRRATPRPRQSGSAA